MFPCAFNIGMFGKKAGGWVNPYVTDGLVAMWDGEWNAGGGVTDHSTNSVANIANGNLGSITGVTFHENNTFRRASDFVFNVSMKTPLTVEFGWYNPPADLSSRYPISLGQNKGDKSGGNSLTYHRLYNKMFSFVYFNGTRNSSSGSSESYARKFFHASISWVNSIPITYWDGARKNSSSLSSFDVNNIFDALSIGFDIKFGYIRFYNRALSAQDVAANYVIDAKRFGLT